MCMYAESREECQMSSFIMVCLTIPRQGFLVNRKLAIFIRLAGQRAVSISLSPFPIPGFLPGFWDLTQILMFVEYALLTTEPLSTSKDQLFSEC